MNKFTKHFLLVYLTVIILAVVPVSWAQETSETTPEVTTEPEATIETTAEPEATIEPTAEATAAPIVEPTIEAPPAPTDEPPIVTPPADSFVDHFDNGNAWSLAGWQVINGLLTTSEANASATLLGVNWPHLLFSATVQVRSGSAVGIVLRSSGENYTIGLDSSGRTTLARSGVLLAESAPIGETDTWRTIQIQALGGIITAAVDSVVQFSYDDSPGLGAGAIGFLSGGPVAIDNVSIIRLDAPPVVVVEPEVPVEPTIEVTEVAVTPTADEPPVITGLAASYDTQAGETLALTFSVSDDADLVAVTADTDSSAGKVALTAVSSSALPFNTNVSIQYFPAEDFSGMDQFTIIVTDAGGNIVSADVQVNVAASPASSLKLLTAYSFDDDELADLVLRPGWAVLDGTLQASNTPESADILAEFGSGAIHTRLLLDSGGFNLAFRQQWQDMTATGYTAVFRAGGEVALYRSGTLLASAPADIAGQWRAIRVLAEGGDLTIEIDGVVVLAVTDPDPLPAGEISFTAPDTVAADENSAPGVMQMDDVEIWVETPTAPTLVPGDPLPAPPGIANIGDRVWLDNNGNGLQDSGEPGIANIRLHIYRSNGVYYGSTLTNSLGHYQLAVPSGYSYYLSIEVPQGYILTNPNISGSSINSDFDPITRRTITTYLSSGQDSLIWDAGLIALSICQENSAIDIMLVLDGSSSISAANFALMKNFASGLVQSFNVGTNTARFGVVQFSTRGRGRLETGLSTSQSAVLSRIHNMVQINSMTDIAEGLRLAQDELGRNGRNVRQVPRAIVLLTDGVHQPINGIYPNDPALTQQINRAKNAKSLVYGIAVGSGVNMAQINQIASDPDHRFVFSVSSFAGLVQALRSVASNTCYTPVLPYLPPPVLSPLHNSFTNDNTPTFNWGSIPFTSYLFGGFFQIVVDNNTSFASPEYAATISGLSATPIIRLPDGRYYCRIRAGNILGFGPWSRVFQIVIDTVPPPAPVLSMPVDGFTSTNARQSLTWRAAPGAKLYDIQIAPNTSFTTLVYNQRGLNRTSFAPPTSLRQGTYYWRVRAVDAAGNIGTWSLQRRFNVNILKSPADTAYFVSPTSAARPTFTIAAVPGAVRYHINIATTSGFGSSTLYADAFTGTSYKMPANFPLGYGLYHWRVNIDMGSGFVASPFSRILIITPPAPTRPSLSSPANTVALNSPRPSLFWNAITYNYAGVGVYYEVQVDNNSNFASPERIFSTYGQQYNIATNLLDGTYYWRVRAINNLGYPGPYSSPRRFNIDTIPPSQATLNTPVNNAFVSSARPQLKWFAAAGASQYRVQIDNNSNFSSPEVDAFPVRSTSFTPPASLPQGLYYWRVRAVDAAGNLAPWSAARSLNISIALRPAHGTFIVSATNAARPTFTWAGVPGAASYQLAIASTPSFGASTFYAIPLTTTSHTLPAVHSLNYGTYYWRVNLDLGTGFVGAPYYQQLTITP